MGERLANPKTLGFSAFAIITWMFSMLDAHWYGTASTGATIHEVASLSAIALLIAALVAFLRGDGWNATFFMFWTAVVWGYRTGLQAGMGPPTAFAGWFDITIALVSLFLFFGALRLTAGVPVVLTTFFVTLAFIFWAVEPWTGARWLTIVGGYAGLLTGLCAFWAAASGVTRLETSEAAA